MSHLGFIGLGQMGTGMATNLQAYLSKSDGSKYDKQLLVWNRSKKSPPTGAIFVESLQELAKQCTVVFSCVRDDAALKQVVEEFLKGVDKPVTFVGSSTVSPETVEQVASQCKVKGVDYVAAQVFGRPDAAAAGQLLVVLGGEEKPKALVKEIFVSSMARDAMDSGDIKSAPILKLIGNNMILSSIELLAEAMTLADSYGIQRQVFKQLIKDKLFGSIVWSGYGSRMCDDDFDATVGFPVAIGLKDASLVDDLKQKNHVSMPTFEAAYDHLQQSLEKGRGDLDWGSLATIVREKAGRPPGC